MPQLWRWSDFRMPEWHASSPWQSESAADFLSVLSWISRYSSRCTIRMWVFGVSDRTCSLYRWSNITRNSWMVLRQSSGSSLLEKQGLFTKAHISKACIYLTQSSYKFFNFCKYSTQPSAITPGPSISASTSRFLKTWNVVDFLSQVYIRVM